MDVRELRQDTVRVTLKWMDQWRIDVKSYLILIQEVKMDGLLPQQSDQNQYILKLFMILFIYLVVL